MDTPKRNSFESDLIVLVVHWYVPTSEWNVSLSNLATDHASVAFPKSLANWSPQTMQEVHGLIPILLNPMHIKPRIFLIKQKVFVVTHLSYQVKP